MRVIAQIFFSDHLLASESFVGFPLSMGYGIWIAGCLRSILSLKPVLNEYCLRLGQYSIPNYIHDLGAEELASISV